jgi:hypothetical protein
MMALGLDAEPNEAPPLRVVPGRQWSMIVDKLFSER